MSVSKHLYTSGKYREYLKTDSEKDIETDDEKEIETKEIKTESDSVKPVEKSQILSLF